MNDIDTSDNRKLASEISHKIIDLLNDSKLNNHRHEITMHTICLVILQIALNVCNTKEKQKEYIEILFKISVKLLYELDFQKLTEDLTEELVK